MSKEIYISSTPHETRLAIVENDQVSEIYYERENEYTLAGSIYNGKVTRVLPGMQSAFVDIGLERDAFLYVTDFMEEQEDPSEFESGESQSRGGERRRGRRSEVRSESEEGQTMEASGEPSEEESTEEGGARRWRGRRGRRRGRGSRDEGQESVAAPVEGETTEIIGGYEGDDDLVSEEQGAESEVEISASAEERPREERRGRRERDRRGRGRDRDRGERRERPSYGSYANESEEEFPEPTGEPIILPGERLAKYGGVPEESNEPAGQQAGEATPAVTVTIPSYEVVGWDGGLVLPGETIRPRGPVSGEEAAEEPRREREGRREERGRRGRDRRGRGRERGPRREREERSEEPAELEAVPAVEIAEEEFLLPEIHAHAEEPGESSEEQSLVEEVIEHVAEAEGSPSVLESFELGAPHVEIAEEPKEFEPEEGASASVVEAPKAGFLSSWRERRAAAKAAKEAAKRAEEEKNSGAHDYTAVQATGEMISRFPEDEALPQHDTPNPASPVEHEKAVQSVSLADAERTPAPHSFGEGQVEEEFLEDEDFSVDALHAHHTDDDDFEVEEETLEGSAELSGVLRDVEIEENTPEDDELSDDFSDVEERPEEGEQEGSSERRPRRRDGRRDGRRDSRRPGGRGRSRQRVQTQDLPAINELLKPGQEILVQIAKEPIAKKGARITSHIALPGRFLVFMPTVNHTGVSRKIESDAERRRLKSILLSEKGEATGGFIVRTAAEGASEEELRSDLRFLINLWNDIKSRSEASKSPALIYHDLNLVERILRDQVGDNFSAIWVDSEADYERILRFLQRFQPSLIRRVKLYTKQTPLFEQFGISNEIDKALKSKVWLKSGGSIVINQTEALVAIDINTGKYVGKTARLEDTIVKTNLDAIPEIVRQIRLRDLGGIIVIDFIDMDERKNRQKVLQALEEELKTDRAPSKVLQFNDFGLVAITRKRVRQSLERTLSTPCAVCTGTGMVKSPVTVANEIYIEMRKMYKSIDKDDMMLRVHPEVVKQLKLNNSRWLHDMEEMTSKTILVKSDPSLSPEQFDIH